MEHLKPLINQLADIIKGTKDFTVAQSPEFVRQYLTMKLVDAVGWIVFSTILFVLILKLEKKLRKACRVDGWDEKAFFYLPIFVFGVWTFYGILANIADIVEIWIAPKAWFVANVIILIKSK